MILRTKAILIGLLVVLLVGVPPGLGQQPPVDSQGNLYSIWLKLSLMGHNQSEIEAILNGVTPEQLNRIKNQLRRDVLNTLRRLNLHNEISMSTTEQELFTIREKIRTEIRFAGMENDSRLRRMIRHQFGIALQNI
ncbi:MAG: hypothetical protein VW809_15615 [Deltaproteobacteria bacterium]|jgi:hypothetical protein|nr:hypothetical protein [SAR324 cluster bacterium]GIR31935.1 MAG: hypothetical protein CM15mP45_12310 [Deltaproteobacteria bacterium]MDP7406488.1 hypothetical protein [SAR324 cluster bacterium]MEC7214114.1 hypothetical protein [SAR324 cluster bacterium]MEC7467122.1 hypothetical protein [SAR324 cluster bacterium]|tara:strand:- start:115 stop:522 length:408 start_codon:yes stop_codon:yes gene_type:complete